MIKRIPPYLHPLPLLKPHKPPAKVLNLCKQQAQLQTLNLPAVPQLEDENLLYSSFQRNQCAQCQLLIQRIQTSEEALNKLIKANQQLQQKVYMLQDERWKKNDYSANNSSRLRSKSAKPQKKIPTIEVKVPSQLKANQIVIEREQYQKTQQNRQNQQISFLLQQLQNYHEQIKQLTQQNKNLKQQLINNAENQAKKSSQYFRERASLPLENRQPTRSYSLLTENMHERNNKVKNPDVTDFSPLPKNSSLEVTQTVKKDFSNEPANGFQMEIRRLNNEVLYKDLLLDKIKIENMKQKGVLQRHLHLSVQQSKRIAEETTSVCNQFKSELIKLVKQLEASKMKCAKLQSQLSRHESRQELLIFDHNTNNEATLETKQLLQILKTRRSEHLAG